MANNEYEANNIDDINDTGSIANGISTATKPVRSVAGKTAKKTGKKAGKATVKASAKIGKWIAGIIASLSPFAIGALSGLLVIIVVISAVAGNQSNESGGSAEYDETAAAFTPRLTAPAANNQYYYSNLNPFYASGFGLPNCTAYAYGRAYEILGSEPNLCLGNAEDWFNYNRQHGYYEYGNEARVGAIACWKYKYTSGGHVAVVEKVENDGARFTFSNSAYPSNGSSGEIFYTTEGSKFTQSRLLNDRAGWEFQGFIYIYDEETASQNSITISEDVPTELPQAAQKIASYFLQKGLNQAAVCGLLGNIYQECSFNPSVYFAGYVPDAGGATGNSSGICMWYGDNCTRFRRDCPNWGTSLDAQIEYLYQTLIKDGQGSYEDKYYYYCTGCWENLRAVPNTEEGARQAAIIFRDYYERPNMAMAGPREEYAVNYFRLFNM